MSIDHISSTFPSEGSLPLPMGGDGHRLDSPRIRDSPPRSEPHRRTRFTRYTKLMPTASECQVPDRPLTAKSIRASFGKRLQGEEATAIQEVVAHGEAVVPALRSLLDDAESRVVQRAAKALALLGDDKALHLLVYRFFDEPGVPEWVARLGIKGARALLTIRDDRDGDIAIAVLVPSTSTIEPELLRIAAANEDVPWSAINLLGHSGTQEAFAALVAILKDRKRGDITRADAAMVLGRAGYDGAADLLRTLLEDEGERATVRKACKEELERLSRKRAAVARRRTVLAASNH